VASSAVEFFRHPMQRVMLDAFPTRMSTAPPRKLRVLLADERPESLEKVSAILTRLGHQLIARETNVSAVAALAERDVPDVAIVVVGDHTERALDLVGQIVREAICPVIAVLDVEDPAFIRNAAKRGLFAYVANGDLGDEELESALEIVLYRFAEYHDLEGAFGRRALIERAKGILMERHSIDEEAAFRMLRDQSRATSRKLIEIVEAVLDAHAMLPRRADEARD
jgi:AmiR/NasT family two-component response regulator